MHPQIRLLHWRDGMSAHRRMTVDAIRLRAARGGEQVTERAIASEVRLPADDRHKCIAEVPAQTVDGHADIAHLRRAVESGTHLIMHHAHAERREQRADALEFRAHRGRCERTRGTRNADGVQRAERGETRGRRRFNEQHRPQAGAGEMRERVGGAGEVIAIEAVRRGRHARAPKKSSAAASSGACFAYSCSGVPERAASHACRTLATPAATPPG
ncbi:hypothetical protein AWB74_08787 [Caballeronia arvi]|uniref:Uncharacterized protein n=1 Tax=Caballeronia arvi TaxID=1777135 RepID=A0A158L6F1_9BURK|nr:hypothetical protein AWB74_08787 [Caballeronia arvi]